MQNNQSNHFGRQRAVAGAMALLLSMSAHAQTRQFDVGAGELKPALDKYITQAGVQILYRSDDVKGLSTRGLKGSLEPLEALSRLLDGTRLKVRRSDDGAMVIFRASLDEDRSELVDTLETVVVSASRRREPVREVPMQVNRLNTADLERAGAKTLTDYLADQPGININDEGGSGMGSVSIRGVTAGQDVTATVGVYVDEVSIGSSSAYGGVPALDMALLDLNHIEVLRGPQGTLYGAGSMGGLLKYVTNEPDTYEFSGRVSLGASSTHLGGASHTVNGIINVPLKEDIAGLRISAFRDHKGGQVDAVGAAAGKDVDRGNTTGARASLLVAPNHRLKLRLTATTQEIKHDGINLVPYDTATAAPVEGEFTQRIEVDQRFRQKIDLASADVEYDYGWARLNWIAASQTLNYSMQADLTSLYVPALAEAGLDLATAFVQFHTQVKKQTQELRLTSQPGQPVQWLAGLYYQRESARVDQVIHSTIADGSPGPDLRTGLTPTTFRETAFYGDVTWNLLPRTSVTAGIRISRNRQTFAEMLGGLLFSEAPPTEGSSSESSKTYLLTARYALTPRSNLYVRAASGYRPGGPNGVVRIVGGELLVPPTFQHDSLWSYEFGYKADLLDKTLTLEGALYDIRWNQLQQPYSANGVAIIVNAGKAHLQGGELAVGWRPAPDWRLSANLSLINARLSEDAIGLGAPRGTRLPNSARVSSAFGVFHDFKLAGCAAYAGLSQRFVGQRNSGFEGTNTLPNYALPAYALTDLQAGIEFQRIQLAAYIRNLFDKRALLSATGTTQVISGGSTSVAVAQARTVGITVSVPF